MLLYADDGKTASMASDLQDCLSTQADLDAIERWSVVNCLPLSLAKCLCLHLGHGNICYTYTLGGVPLPAVEQCTNLSVIHTSDFSHAAHIHSVVYKASRAVGMITRAFSNKNEHFLKKLFVAYARPIMEYASAVWNPLCVGLDNDLEKCSVASQKGCIACT